jgi:hypothetical protein
MQNRCLTCSGSCAALKKCASRSSGFQLPRREATGGSSAEAPANRVNKRSSSMSRLIGSSGDELLLLLQGEAQACTSKEAVWDATSIQQKPLVRGCFFVSLAAAALATAVRATDH